VARQLRLDSDQAGEPAGWERPPVPSCDGAGAVLWLMPKRWGSGRRYGHERRS
jgi:hypothetical protein